MRKSIIPLTSLRFFAASLVVFFHYSLFIPEVANSIFNPIFSSGFLAVSFFFFLSGFILTYNYKDRSKIDIKSFYKKRFFRIYPVYFLGTALTLSISWLSNSYPRGNTIITQVLGIHAWFPGMAQAINYPSWSVSVELFLYALFPFLISIHNNNKKLFTALAILLYVVPIVGCFLLTSNNFTKSIHYFQNSPITHLGTFMLGMVGGNYILKHSPGKFTSNLLFIIPLVIMLYITYEFAHINHYASFGLYAILFLPLHIGITNSKTIFHKFFSLKILEILGKSSYSLYILQYPVLLIFRKIFPYNKNSLEDFTLYFITLIVISILSHQFIEKRFVK